MDSVHKQLTIIYFRTFINHSIKQLNDAARIKVRAELQSEIWRVICANIQSPIWQELYEEP